MAIPKNITKEHLLKAIQRIDLEGYPKDSASKYYDLIYKDKKYPPKVVLSYANIFANGFELDRNTFDGGEGTECFNLLLKNNFQILKKDEVLFDQNVWIEKTIVSGRQDRLIGERALGKALWSPRKNKGGADIYKNMRNVKPGDIIIHLIDNDKIVGLSIAKSSFEETEGLVGTDWEGPAYLIRLEGFIYLEPPLKKNEILSNNYKNELIKISNTSEVFFTTNLELRQGAYLTPCPNDLLTLIASIYYKLTSKKLPYINIQNTYLDNVNKINSVMFENYKKYTLAIKTKPFIILAGLSGTGKSRIVRTLAYKFNNIPEDNILNKSTPTNYLLIKVKPNWHDSTELLGYESRISGKDRFIITDFIRFIVKAWQFPNTPFFICLDEMNLAPVEQYFAEYLSVIETRRLIDDIIKTDSLISDKLIRKYSIKESGVDIDYDLWNELDITDENLQNNFKLNGIGIPQNLIIVGTVNMDETTHSFSRKVLDRAMTIEMNEINLQNGLIENTNDWSYPLQPLKNELVISEKTLGSEVFNLLGSIGDEIIKYLDLINIKLESTPFKIAYRVRDEFLLYAYNYSLIESKSEDWIKYVLDEMTLMKILPRIEGDEDKTKLLDDLIIIFQENNLLKSLNKATEMANRRRLSHYTSFWS